MKELGAGSPVIDYDQFNMLPRNPLGKAAPVNDIAISGNTATFTSGGLRFTGMDNYRGVTEDSIRVNEGIREYPVSLFDGELRIISAQ